MEVFKRIQETPVEHFPPVILVTGEEPLLMKRYVDRLIHRLIPDGMKDMNLVTYEENQFSFDQFMESLETLPMLAEKKIVLVKNPGFLDSKGSSWSDHEMERFERYLQSPASECVLVLLCTKKPDARKKMYRALKAVAWVPHLPRLNERQLKSFIQSEFKQKGKQIEPAALKRLMDGFDYFGRNAHQDLQDVVHEIQKLNGYLDEKKLVTREEIEWVTPVAFQNDVFQLIESLAFRRGSEAQVRYGQLLDAGEPVMKIIGYLRNQFRLMLRVKWLENQGYQEKKIATKLQQHPYAIKKSSEYGRQFEYRELIWMLNGFLRMDRHMKNGTMDAKTGMELLIAECSRQ